MAAEESQAPAPLRMRDICGMTNQKARTFAALVDKKAHFNRETVTTDRWSITGNRDTMPGLI